MKKLNIFSKGQYEAPVCDSAAYLQNCICSESVTVSTDDYTDGGTFEW